MMSLADADADADADGAPAATGRAMPTLEDVAREAGVSLATASRVLNGSSRTVAESYRVRVETAARSLGYSPNLSAQAMARGTSAVVSLLVADIADPYFGLLASGVARGADEAGLVVTISITERDPQRELRLVSALRGQRPRGLILAASRSTVPSAPQLADELELLGQAGGRVVALGPGAGGIRSVPIDNRGGARDLGAALGRLGYRSAVVLAAAEGTHTSDDRVAGFTEGFIASGGTEPRILRDGFTRESGERLMRQLLDEGAVFGTLVFAVSDIIAAGAHAALRRSGREVGADIALAGFDDIPLSRDLEPPLTTVHVPLEDVGYEALRATVDDDWTPDAARFALEVRLRASTPARAS